MTKDVKNPCLRKFKFFMMERDAWEKWRNCFKAENIRPPERRFNPFRPTLLNEFICEENEEWYISHGFNWGKTLAGYEYWNHLNDEWLKYIKHKPI